MFPRLEAAVFERVLESLPVGIEALAAIPTGPEEVR
jgi:hypothetical protein